MTILVISANFGGECFNKVVEQVGYNVDFKCLDNSNYPLRTLSLHPRMLGKIPKMLAWELYPNYDIYIWIDGVFNINKPDLVGWLIDHLRGKECAFFKHPFRSSIKEEAEFVLSKMEKGDKYLLERYRDEDIRRQIDTYLADTSFEDNALFAAGVFIYKRHLVQNRYFNPMIAWFYHNCLYSIQDQISLPYILHQYNVEYNTVNENIYSLMNRK